MSWNDSTVNTYEQTIPLKIPGYFTLYEMMNHFLSTTIPLEYWGRFENSFEKEIFPISETDLLTIMEECGFTQITRFFTSFFN